MKQETLILVAGGSGGHIIPALQLGKQWKEKQKSGNIIFIGQKGLLDEKILKDKNFLHEKKLLKLGKFSLKRFWGLPVLLWQLAVIFCRSSYFFSHNKPSKIITTGGLLAIPVCLAGWLKKIPVQLYELNVIPGRAINVLSHFADKTYVVFDKTTSYFAPKLIKKCSKQNYPIRFVKQNTNVHKENLIRYINQFLPNKPLFDTSRKTLFILGGSQGSLLLNKLAMQFVLENKHIQNNLQIIHQTGSIGKTDWQNFYASHNIPAFTFSFYKNIEHCYLLSDLVLCRAGAGTLFELLFFEKQSIVIPLITSTTDHQIENAREMEYQFPSLFSVIEQKNITKSQRFFFDLILKKLDQKVISQDQIRHIQI